MADYRLKDFGVILLIVVAVVVLVHRVPQVRNWIEGSNQPGDSP